MKEAFKTYERSIKKKQHFAWKLQHQEEFRTALSSKSFVAVALKTFHDLGWRVVYYDDKSIEAKTVVKSWQSSQKITITFEHGKVGVHSVSPNENFWDKGVNSKRVRLFIYAFQETAKTINKEELASLEQEIEQASSWEDYIVPNQLPAPPKRPLPKLGITFVGSVVLGVTLGFAIAFLNFHWAYYFIAFELFTGLLLAGAFGQLIKASHYTNFAVLNGLLMATVLSIYLLYQYFLYFLLIEQGGMPPIDFWSYFQSKFEAGFQLEDNNFGKIGWVLSWLVQLVLTYSIARHFLMDSISNYKAARVPDEVRTFALYSLSKNNKKSVRLELAKKGWKKQEDQEDVFEALALLQKEKDFYRNL